jgi:glutathione S-transferase
MRWPHRPRRSTLALGGNSKMKLYFSPLACSTATRIALYEAGADAEFVEVDPKTKRTSDGRDFHDVHPLGLVPALELPSGKLLTENAAVLQYVARAFPEAGLAPTDADGVTELQQWLAVLHRDGAPQGAVRAAPRRPNEPGRDGVLARPRRFSPRLRGPSPVAASIPARPLQRRGRVPLHGVYLEPGDAGRFEALASAVVIPRASLGAPGHRARLRGRAGALPARAGATIGGAELAVMV